MITIGVGKFQRQYDFRPALHLLDALALFGDMERQFHNDDLYALAKRLTKMANPSDQNEYDKRWFSFHVPLRRDGRVIAVPFWAVKYRDGISLGIPRSGAMVIYRGNETLDYPERSTIIRDAIKLARVLKKGGMPVLKHLVPYDYRTGRILGRHLFEKIMGEGQRKRHIEEYRKQEGKNLEVKHVSLNDYLETAEVCYKAAFGKKTAGLTPLEMYARWADGRHDGMLDISEPASPEAFGLWANNTLKIGHPYEIVFSWHEHGIHLYPPSEDVPRYRLFVTNYVYAEAFVRMASALVRANIPLEARNLSEVLNYLAGKTYFRVNEYAAHHFLYLPNKDEKRRYFRHIDWEEPKLLEYG